MILRSDLLVDLTSTRDVWKYVTMRLGVPSVMALGQPMMPMLPADNWDMLQQVNVVHTLGRNYIPVPTFSHFKVQGHILMPSLVKAQDPSTSMTSSALVLRIVLWTVEMVALT